MGNDINGMHVPIAVKNKTTTEIPAKGKSCYFLSLIPFIKSVFIDVVCCYILQRGLQDKRNYKNVISQLLIQSWNISKLVQIRFNL